MLSKYVPWDRISVTVRVSDGRMAYILLIATSAERSTHADDYQYEKGAHPMMRRVFRCHNMREL